MKYEPFALSLSKGCAGFDPSTNSGQTKLSPNGIQYLIGPEYKRICKGI